MPNGQIISPVLTDPASVQDLGPLGPDNGSPSLKAIAEVQRTQMTSFNTYKNDVNTNNYSAQHPNAQADGDNYGRGDVNGFVGTKIDKIAKMNLLNGNKYKPNSGYNGLNYGEQYW